MNASALLTRFLLAGAVFLAGLLPAGAAPFKNDHIEAEIVAENTSIQPGKPFTVALRFKLAPKWHSYWIHSGDEFIGEPTTLKWTLPEGFQAGPLQFPYPHVVVQWDIPGLSHEGEVYHLVEITPPATLAPGAEVTLKGRAKWQACEEICVPGDVELSLTLPVKEETAQPGPLAAAFAAAREKLPVVPEGWETSAAVEGNDIVITVKNVTGLASIPPAAKVYSEALAIDPLGKSTFSVENGILTIKAPKHKAFKELAKPFRAVIVSEQGFGDAKWRHAIQLGGELAPPVAAPATPTTGDTGAESGGSDTEAASAASLGENAFKMLLFGFLGGLILNVMPCVFPVISLKIMSFVNQAGEEKSKVLKHGLAFTLGVLVFFWVIASILLAIRAAGGQADWAAQFQVPGFVLGMAVVMLIIALWLFGLLELGTSLTGVGGKLAMASGYGGSFWSGALATLLATPCTGPFLGPAIFFGLSSPVPLALLFFTIMGLGMSLPYLILAAFPALLKKLPRPGAWMESFKQFMGFPMLATVAWLVWTLGGLVESMEALYCMLALVFVALAVWILHRFASPYSQSKARGRIAALIAVGMAAWLGYEGLKGGTGAAHAAETSGDPLARIEELRAEGKPVFVDFTARWCLICQVNKAVLHDEEVEKALEDAGIEFVIVDYTKRDAKISEYLNQNGRSGVPYYPMFPADASKPPIVLPNTLTKGAVLEAIAKIKGS